MSNKRKTVDPVHFFDERGHALSSYAVLEQENRSLKARNERLEAMLKALKARAALTESEPAPIVTTLH